MSNGQKRRICGHGVAPERDLELAQKLVHAREQRLRRSGGRLDRRPACVDDDAVGEVPAASERGGESGGWARVYIYNIYNIYNIYTMYL